MKKNLLVYIEDPRFGGPHQYTLSTLDYLRKKFKIRILFSNIENEIFLKKVKEKKIKFDTFPICFLSLRFLNILRYIFYFAFDLYKLRNYLKKKNIDVIYSTSGFYSIKIIIASLFLNIKIIVHFHDTFCNIFFLKLGFFSKNFIDLFIFSSLRSFSFYKNLVGKRKYFITQSAINIINRKKKYKKKLKKNFDIVTVSNINPVKRIEILVKLASRLKDRNIRFHLVGKVWESQRDYNNKIRDMVKINKLSNLFFYNFGNKKKLQKILLNSDLYLCVSKYESSPMSVWEAMSFSLPILSSDVGDLDYFNKRFNFGFIIKKKEIQNFEKKILEIYSNKNLKNKLGRNAKKFVLKNINIKKTMNNFQKNFFKV